MKIKILSIFVMLFIISSSIATSVNLNQTSNESNFELASLLNEGYYSFDELTALLEQLQQDFPTIFSYESLGKTYEGRDIWLVKISDNVEVDGGKPGVIFTGAIHGNEKPSYEVLIHSFKAIVENYTYVNVNESFSNRIRNIVNNTELYFIPMLNPDGVEAQTRKNRRPNDCILGDTLFRGVDLNRNFGYKWEDFVNHPLKYSIRTFFSLGVRSTVMFPFLDAFWSRHKGVYRGPYPFSENETRAIKDFVESHNNIVAGIDYHTYAEKIGYPWAWTEEAPPDEAVFVSIAENISIINGYSVIQFSDWYVVNGFFTDWMYGEHGIFHFIIELDATEAHGPRFKRNFKPVSEICETHLLVNLYLAERALTLK